MYISLFNQSENLCTHALAMPRLCGFKNNKASAVVGSEPVAGLCTGILFGLMGAIFILNPPEVVEDGGLRL